ncbi:MAG: hypothetical protein OXC29_25535, partial [Rhodococcus sp.]|nr:hypothetical protein [Rhodococcus sp. (in: high G+C Gram-positive bacteria)]
VKGLVGLGSTLGLEYDDVNATLAATAQVAKSVRIAETQIRSFFQSFTSPTEDAKKALAEATGGLLTFQDIRNSLDTQGTGPTFKFLQDLIGDDIELKTRLIPRIEGQLFFDTVNPDDLQNILSQIDPQGAAVDVAFEAGSEGIERRTDILKQEALNRLADIGERLIPVFDRFEETLRKIFDLYDGLTDEQKGWVASVLAAGPGMIAVGAALKILAPIVGLFKVALFGVTTAGLILFAKLAIIFAAIAGLVYLFWTPISTFVKGFVDQFRENFDIVMDGVKGLADAFSDAWNTIKPPLQPILDFFTRLRSSDGAGAGGGVATGVLWVLRILLEGVAFVVRVLGWVFRIVFEMIRWQIVAAIAVVAALITTWNALWTAGEATINALKTAFWAFVDAMKWAFDQVMIPINAVVDAVQWVIDKVREAIELIKNLNPGQIMGEVGGNLLDNPLTRGVKSGLGAVRNLLPFSDAKEGPLSDLSASGRAFWETFARGVESGAPLGVGAVAGQLLGGAPVPVLGGGSQTVQITVDKIEVSGDNAAEGAGELGDALQIQIRDGYAQFGTPFVA